MKCKADRCDWCHWAAPHVGEWGWTVPCPHCLGAHQASLGEVKAAVVLQPSGCWSRPRLLGWSSVGCTRRAKRCCKKRGTTWRTPCPSALSVGLPAPCAGSPRVGPASGCSGLDRSPVPRTGGKTLAFETRQQIAVLGCFEGCPVSGVGCLGFDASSVCLVSRWKSSPVQSRFLLCLPACPHVLFVLDKVLKITPWKAKLETSLLGEDFL